MDSVQINNRSIQFLPLINKEIDELIDYFNGLGVESKKRFGPHPFTRDSLMQFYHDSSGYYLFTAKSQYEQQIVAYTILKRGWLDFEHSRLSSYGLVPKEGDFTIAPSVADAWQGKGIGSAFLRYLIDHGKNVLHAQRFILWGGVQSDNIKAIKLYQKIGFRTLGQFEYNGLNLDMIFDL